MRPLDLAVFSRVRSISVWIRLLAGEGMEEPCYGEALTYPSETLARFSSHGRFIYERTVVHPGEHLAHAVHKNRSN